MFPQFFMNVLYITLDKNVCKVPINMNINIHLFQIKQFGAVTNVYFGLKYTGKRVYLVLQEQSLELPLRPEVHGVGQKLGGHCVYSQEVSHKHHSLDFLVKKKKTKQGCQNRTQTSFTAQ